MTSQGEGLKVARLLMVLSGLSPLFILWAVRGVAGVRDEVLVPICASLVVVPTLLLAARISIAQVRGDRRTLVVGTTEDHRDHLLVYLFAVLMPLYDVNLGDTRQVWAMVIALLFVVFLFWHIGLHYVNLAFALVGYHVFSVKPLGGNAHPNGRAPFVLLTRRTYLNTGESISALRLSNTVYIEREAGNEGEL